MNHHESAFLTFEIPTPISSPSPTKIGLVKFTFKFHVLMLLFRSVKLAFAHISKFRSQEFRLGKSP